MSRFYGTIDSEEALGIGERVVDWKGIAHQLEEYIEKNGALSMLLDWSTGGHDYKGMHVGLESVGKAHLLPPMSRWESSPLSWWRIVRKTYNCPNLSLSLGNIFSILFPDHLELLSRAHWADADVKMTVKVIQYLFSHLEGTNMKTAMESWVIKLDEKDIVSNGEIEGDDLRGIDSDWDETDSCDSDGTSDHEDDVLDDETDSYDSNDYS